MVVYKRYNNSQLNNMMLLEQDLIFGFEVAYIHEVGNTSCIIR